MAIITPIWNRDKFYFTCISGPWYLKKTSQPSWRNVRGWTSGWTETGPFPIFRDLAEWGIIIVLYYIVKLYWEWDNHIWTTISNWWNWISWAFCQYKHSFIHFIFISNIANNKKNSLDQDYLCFSFNWLTTHILE